MAFKAPMNADPFTFSNVPQFKENHDLIKKLRMGQYKASNIVYYNNFYYNCSIPY